MSKRRWVAAKLFAVLGGAGLALGVSVPRANAATTVPPFSNTNYANRYVCNVTADGNFYTAIMRLVPNGSGAYTNGSLIASISPFAAFDPTASPSENSCSYTLVIPSSSYVVSSNGLTTEVLTWKAAAENKAACPDSPGSFVMSQESVLRGNVNANGKVQNTSISSGNLLDQSVLLAIENPGDGWCEK